MEFACAIAVCIFNDGVTSLSKFSEKLKLDPTPFCNSFLKHKDQQRIKSAVHRDKEATKKQRRIVQRKRKGLQDEHAWKEGVMYASGAFETGE